MRGRQIAAHQFGRRHRRGVRSRGVTADRSDDRDRAARPGAIGQHLLEMLGIAAARPSSAPAPACWRSRLADGTAAFATVRRCHRPRARSPSFQRARDALAAWRSDTTLTVTLSATTGFVLLILGFAFHWQATRAREADVIYDTVRSRIDTALNRGRCGLWDWDLARGRIFWSHSMFAILGLQAARRPADLRRGQRAGSSRRSSGSTSSRPSSPTPRPALIDHEFRMHHANGNWVWLRARCELVQQPGETGAHLIGIAVDITEQKTLVERTAAADLRLRDAIETIPEAFVLWDANNRLVLCNSNFQELHNLPDEAIAAGHAVRRGGRGRTQAGGALQGDQRKPAARAPAPSRRNSTTAAGCTSASAAPRTAAMCRSAPTSPRSSAHEEKLIEASSG